MPTTAAATAKLIADAGIDRVFGLPGGEVLLLIDELRKVGVDFVLMRHEANAGLAAAVYGKLRRQPGVVLATLGPGAANLLLPMTNAWLDQEPLLAITAQIPAEFPASHTHQLLPLHDIYRPVCREVAAVRPDTVGDVVPRALAACMERPYATAYLTLSARDAREEAVAGSAASPGPGAASAAAGGTRAASRPRWHRDDPRARARELTDLLRGARAPLVLAGLGVNPAHANRIRRWLDTWKLPVAVTPKVKGIVDETSDLFVGVVGGMAADGLMCRAVEAADVRIGLGFDPVEVDKTWHAELPIHWVLEAPNACDVLPEGTGLVDHAALFDALAAEPPPSAWGTPFAEFQRERRDLLTRRTGAPGVMWPGDIVQALAGVLPPETIATTDVGSHKYLFGQFWPSRVPETFWMSNGLSGMAYGLSAAIGAKLARPDAPVLAAVGDGGFSMNAQELETAVRVGAPFVTVVLEDGSYSLIKLAQETRKLEPYRMDFGRIDTVAMAQACGVEAMRTTEPEELAAAVTRAVESGTSLVVAVPVAYSDYRGLF
ncbi:MAG: thiamine pyrophosphate-binding protein [Acidobacteriota bacterium]